MAEQRKGSCLCGGVRFTIAGEMRPVIACHCIQCRKQTGHFYAATAAPETALKIEGESNLTWYQSSPEARRGFCTVCGSALFWKSSDSDMVSIGAGTLDNPTGLVLSEHIYCADKGDYYEIADELPQHPKR